MGPRVAAALIALACLACAGCGLGPGPGTPDVSVRVSRAFGADPLKTVTEPSTKGSETVMRLLQRHFRVTTRYGGGFVQSIDGRAGAKAAYRDWFFYVNGVQAKQGAAAIDVHRGDHVWWDLHDWSQAQTIPAVVGSFPEPFRHGIGGRRYPTTLECATNVGRACTTAADAMSRLHVATSRQLLGTGSGPDTLGLNIGTWSEMRPQVGAGLIDHGPGAGGVYVRFSDDGRRLSLLDARGHVTRTLGPGAGLIAATADESSVPTWFVTGTDTAGVLAAARALTPAALSGHFALAVDGGHRYPVPTP